MVSNSLFGTNKSPWDESVNESFAWVASFQWIWWYGSQYGFMNCTDSVLKLNSWLHLLVYTRQNVQFVNKKNIFNQMFSKNQLIWALIHSRIWTIWFTSPTLLHIHDFIMTSYIFNKSGDLASVQFNSVLKFNSLARSHVSQGMKHSLKTKCFQLISWSALKMNN